MLFEKSITTDANTSQNNAETTKILCSRGIIHQIEIEFPPGCSSLCHVQLYAGTEIFLPSRPDMDMSADAHTIVIKEHYFLPNDRSYINVVVWNLDDTYPHTIRVRIAVLDEDDLNQNTGVIKKLGEISNLIKDLIKTIQEKLFIEPPNQGIAGDIEDGINIFEDKEDGNQH